MLREWVTAILSPDDERLASTREECLRILGPEATVQAVSVIASFDGINRVADATGIRLDEESEQNGASEIIEALQIKGLADARST